jgi:carbohydrate-binding DOMON domain-containing protein
MSTQYRLVQSGKTASGGCSAGQGSSEPVAPRIYYLLRIILLFDAMYAELLTALLHEL